MNKLTLTALLAMLTGQALACPPGEIERTFMITPMVQSCTAVMSLPIFKCGEAIDGQQSCVQEWTNPNVCTPEAQTVVTCVTEAEARGEYQLQSTLDPSSR
jgi:hypothetical protein